MLPPSSASYHKTAWHHYLEDLNVKHHHHESLKARIIWVIKLRMRLAGQVTHMGGMRNAEKFQSENLTGRDYLKDLGLDGRIILEWILGKEVGKLWIYSSGSE
jgi:hypothetical protein